MEGRRVLRSLTMKNVLSFGPEGQTLDFEPLNVLIGPNGSGKTNLIEVLGLIRALPGGFFSEAGGISGWLWKGEGGEPHLFIESEWEHVAEHPLRHSLTLGGEEYMPRVIGEKIEPGLLGEVKNRETGSGADQAYYSFSSHEGARQIKVPNGLKTDRSILAQRREPGSPEVDDLRDRFSEIRFFRNWTFGPRSPVRAPQRADLPGDFLEENASNLGLVLNGLSLDRRAKTALLENLRRVYEGARDIRVNVFAGHVELIIEEEDSRPIPAVRLPAGAGPATRMTIDFTVVPRRHIPAMRLSDGTLRYLCLLAILCHPDPPPLICIEEPELGLHPDIIPTIAKLLIDASQRTQLIVTTHSTDLVSALWEHPESVVVCERRFGPTTLERLEPEKLKKWLEKYSLGELWSMGEIGGNRW
jgi:predicted ATPase